MQVQEVLQEVGLEPKSVLVFKAGTLCTLDQIINDEDEVSLTVPMMGG